MPTQDSRGDVSFLPGIAAVVGDAQGGGLRIQFSARHVSDVVGRARPYKNFPYTAKPAIEKVADYFRVTLIPRTFAREGPGWRKLAKRTQRERAAQGYGAQHPILKRTGDLMKELTVKSHPGHVEIIKTGKYSRLILGGSSEKFTRNQQGDADLHIPSRPMIPGTGTLPLPYRDRQEIVRILNDAIRKELAK